MTAATNGRTLALLLALALGLTSLLAWPLARSLFLAMVLAGAFSGVHDWLSARLRGRRHLAAFLIVATLFLVLLIPMGLFVTRLVQEGLGAIQTIAEALSRGGVERWLQRLPTLLRAPLQELIERSTQSAGEGSKGISGEQALAALGGFLTVTGTAVSTLLKLALTTIAMHVLLVDGGRLIDWTERLLPLRPGQVRELLGEFRRVSVAVLRSTLLTALLQSIVATAGYLLARTPQPLFFGALTFVTALIPAAGAALTTLLVALLMLLLGHPIAALFLAAWGLLVVGVVDNLAKPLLIRGDIGMHGAVVFFALVGGLLVFGGVGLVAGPLIVSFLLAVERIREREAG